MKRSDHCDPARMSPGKKCLFSLMVIVVFFLGVELILHLTGFAFSPLTHREDFGEHFEASDQDHYLSDPRLFWRLKPDQTIRTWWTGERGAHINALSLRGPDFEKHQEVTRILCVGDSGTFGWGVNDDETWPAYLESNLNQVTGRRFQVLNAGVNGYSTCQTYRAYQRLDPIINPQIVIVSAGRNDLSRLPVSDPERAVVSEWQVNALTVLMKCRLGQFGLWLSQQHRLDSLKQADSRGDLVERVNAGEFRTFLEAFIHDTSEKNQTLIYLLRGGHTDILNTFTDNPGIHVVRLERYRELGQIALFLEGGHPDKDAYRLIAEAVFHRIGNL